MEHIPLPPDTCLTQLLGIPLPTDGNKPQDVSTMQKTTANILYLPPVTTAPGSLLLLPPPPPPPPPQPSLATSDVVIKKGAPKVGKSAPTKFMRNMLNAYKSDITKKKAASQSIAEDENPELESEQSSKGAKKLSVSVKSTKEHMEQQFQQAEQSKTVENLFHEFLEEKLAKIEEERKAMECEAEKKLDELGLELRERLMAKMKDQPFIKKSIKPLSVKDSRELGVADAQKISMDLKISDDITKSTSDSTKHNLRSSSEDSSDGELPDSDNEKSKKKKRKRSRSRSKGSRRKSRKRKRSRSRTRHSSRSRRSREKRSPSHRHRSRSRDKRRSRSRDRRRSHDRRYRRSRSRDNTRRRSRSRERRRSRSPKQRSKSPDFWRDRPTRRKRLARSPNDRFIDKAKLRAIALAKASQDGGDPVMLSNALAKALPGGSTVQQFTDMCRRVAEGEDAEGLAISDSELEPVVNHPFHVKPGSIQLNIKDARQVPVKTPAERAMDEAKIRQEFPVSSGTYHRPKEKTNEWEPVYPSKPAETESKSKKTAVEEEEEEAELPEEDRVFPQVQEEQRNIDIGTAVAERLKAVRSLQINPMDRQAKTVMHQAEQQISKWTEAKHVPGKFTGSTGAKLLSARELEGDFHIWTRKDTLITAAPVKTGVGKQLLEKMGWKEGQGLGKFNEGAVNPLMLQVKNDRKGLQSFDEKPVKGRAGVTVVRDLQGKHPISALMELCVARHWPKPEFIVANEEGPSHLRSFLFKVLCNNVEYVPAIASTNKKQAKADAATVCLQALGILPKDT